MAAIDYATCGVNVCRDTSLSFQIEAGRCRAVGRQSHVGYTTAESHGAEHRPGADLRRRQLRLYRLRWAAVGSR
jgi:hypothetical protein